MAHGEVALDLQQQATYGIGLASHIGKDFLVELRDFIEIGEQRLGFEYPRMIIELPIGALFFIIFIAYLAHYLLDDVFHGHQSRGAAELIHHDGYMHAVLLKLMQQVVYHLGLWDEVGRTHQRLPAEVVALVQMRQQILDVEDTFYIICIALIDGDARVGIVHDALQHLLERGTVVQRHHVHARSHHLLGRLTAEAYDALQDAALFGELFLIRQIQRMREVIYRDVVSLRLEVLVEERRRVHQHR